MNRTFNHRLHVSGRGQRGAATLAVTILLLAVITIIALFATNTAFFESRTTNNENRARLAEQAAEYGVNLAGEYLKSRLDVIVSSGTGGWMEAGSTRWTPCRSVPTPPAGHPCLAEVADVAGGQRNDLYFTTLADDTDGDATNDVADIILPASTLAAVGEGGAFPVRTKIDALLCRVDTSDETAHCDLFPKKGRNIAVTMIATTSMPAEGTVATVKETWASFSSFAPAAAVPLVASGVVQGLGNAQIVGAPNAGGIGLVASIWSPGNVDIEESGGGGIGSVSSCHLGGYLGHGAVAEKDMLTVCAGQGNTGCGCPGQGDPDFLSGHEGPLREENIDVLDRDGQGGSNDLPDITFFPGSGFDRANDPGDDNLFEAIFDVPYVAEQDGCNEDNAGGCSEDTTTGPTDADCGDANNENCAVWAMREELGFEFVTCAELRALGATASGSFYVTDGLGACGLPDQLGSPDNNVAVVSEGNFGITGNKVIYGLLFIRSDANNAQVTGNGNVKVFGSLVVQGNVNMNGSLDLVYYDWAARAEDPEDPPSAAFFGRLSGSWLDDDNGF